MDSRGSLPINSSVPRFLGWDTVFADDDRMAVRFCCRRAESSRELQRTAIGFQSSSGTSNHLLNVGEVV
jgi:hypothetical protein